MARYFFSLEDGRKISEDQGEELANDEAARAEGWKVAADFARNNRVQGDLRVVVKGADGRLVCEIYLKDIPL